jgi:hypothetical protein
MNVTHIVLLGDSIFDNAAYTDGEPDVVNHLRDLLPPGAKATLLAVDGSLAAAVPDQLNGLPRDATHLVISTGGNDALGNLDLLAQPVESTTEALLLFAARVAPFDASYRQAIQAATALGLPTTVCTIYNGWLPEELRIPARVALAMYNDVIQVVAREFGLDVIELRNVVTEQSDYANPIEPSGTGGRKIARAILDSLALEARSLVARVRRAPTRPARQSGGKGRVRTGHAPSDRSSPLHVPPLHVSGVGTGGEAWRGDRGRALSHPRGHARRGPARDSGGC